MGFIDLVKTRARADKKIMVLPESMGRRTWEVAKTILREDIADLVIVETPEDIADHGKGLDVLGAIVINLQAYEKTQEYIDLSVELRKSKGMIPGEAKETIMSDYAYYGRLMIKNRDADGSVSGTCHPTTDILKPCLQVVGAEPGTKLVSAFFPMVVPDCKYGIDGTLIFADLGLSQNPNPEKLAAVAKSPADSFKLLVQKEARVAMLSHSAKGSAKHPDVDKIVEATRITKELYPELKLDGELQLDAVFISEVASSKAPGGEVAGEVNVLMFPDLDADSIGYKLVQRLAEAEAYSPITQGIVKPVNDLSRSCCTDDIMGAVAITAAQAQTE